GRPPVWSGPLDPENELAPGALVSRGLERGPPEWVGAASRRAPRGEHLARGVLGGGRRRSDAGGPRAGERRPPFPRRHISYRPFARDHGIRAGQTKGAPHPQRP